MDWLVYPLGRLLEWSFGLLEMLGNLPNLAFIVLGFVGLFIWLRIQGKYNKEAANNPDQLQ